MGQTTLQPSKDNKYRVSVIDVDTGRALGIFYADGLTERTSPTGEKEHVWVVKDKAKTIDVSWEDWKNEGEEIKMSEIKDSGERREFETGAVRDISEGKGRCDLLPLDVIGCFWPKTEDGIFKLMGRFMRTGNPDFIVNAMINFSHVRDMHVATLLLEVSKHFEDGCEKYGERNWEKGMPLHCYMDSAIRHYLKWLRRDEDEPHDRAFVWNLLCAIWTLENKPELNDLPCAGK